jgi:hypothetical protein
MDVGGSCFKMEEPMRMALRVVAVVILCAANAAGQGKVLTKEPLTGLPIIPAAGTDEPQKMPDATICKSKMQANLYSVGPFLFSKDTNNTTPKVSATVAWYAAHLTGFKKIHGYESERSQDIFYNADRTVLVIVTGSRGTKSEDTDVFGVAYEKYQPGLSPETIAGLTHGHIVCR